MPFVVVRYDEHGVRRVLADGDQWASWPDTHTNFQAPPEATRYVLDREAKATARRLRRGAYVRFVLR